MDNPTSQQILCILLYQEYCSYSCSMRTGGYQVRMHIYSYYSYHSQYTYYQSRSTTRCIIIEKMYLNLSMHTVYVNNYYTRATRELYAQSIYSTSVVCILQSMHTSSHYMYIYIICIILIHLYIHNIMHTTLVEYQSRTCTVCVAYTQLLLLARVLYEQSS